MTHEFKRYRGIEPLTSVWKTEVIPFYEYRKLSKILLVAFNCLKQSIYNKRIFCCLTTFSLLLAFLKIKNNERLIMNFFLKAYLIGLVIEALGDGLLWFALQKSDDATTFGRVESKIHRSATGGSSQRKTKSYLDDDTTYLLRTSTNTSRRRASIIQAV